MTSQKQVLWARRIGAVAALAGLAASSALSIPYVLGLGGFCGAGGGCDKVAHSSYSTLFGMPRALLGVAVFMLATVAIIVSGRIVRKIGALAGIALVAEGIHLLAVQAFVLHAICPFCVVVDVSSIALGACLMFEGWITREDRGNRLVFAPKRLAVAAALVLAAPMALAAIRPTPKPIVIDEPVKRAADGRLVIREFVDLECPYCRATHAVLQQSIAGSHRAVIIERRHVPLPQHENAYVAAVAACCAGEQGAEDRFVDAVVADDSAPTEANCRKIAEQLGLDMSKFDECRSSGRPKERLAKDAELADKTKVSGLPTIDVEGERHVGALDRVHAEALLSRHP